MIDNAHVSFKTDFNRTFRLRTGWPVIIECVNRKINSNRIFSFIVAMPFGPKEIQMSGKLWIALLVFRNVFTKYVHITNSARKKLARFEINWPKLCRKMFADRNKITWAPLRIAEEMFKWLLYRRMFNVYVFHSVAWLEWAGRCDRKTINYIW